MYRARSSLSVDKSSFIELYGIMPGYNSLGCGPWLLCHKPDICLVSSTTFGSQIVSTWDEYNIYFFVGRLSTEVHSHTL